MPSLSIIVIIYNMRREALRTLFSLSAAYQRNVSESEYEVVVVENGSTEPLDPETVRAFGNNFSYVHLRDAHPSPCQAINHAVRCARGQWVGIMIDGARIASPGLVSSAIAARQLATAPVIATLAWHLGSEPQYLSVKNGYCQQVEDQLLESSNWLEDGYNLFNVSSLAGSSSGGYFAPISESNAVFMPKNKYEALGGFDEAFDLPGGGFANLDFYKRACESDDESLIIILGEGTFHQVHGGVATNAQTSDYIAEAHRQYRTLRGKNFSAPAKTPLYFGRVAKQAVPWMKV